jgi:hypothetical protein
MSHPDFRTRNQMCGVIMSYTYDYSWYINECHFSNIYNLIDKLTGSVRVSQGPRINHLQPGSQD